MCVAETRAVNRTLRKAYGIGICSAEEIGSFAGPVVRSANVRKLLPQPANGNGEPKLRDQLSYTQLAQYLACPLRYRYRYLDGWQEKETRASMRFGRAFEKAVAAYFRREDSTHVLFQEWAASKDAGLEFPHGTTWDDMLHRGLKLLERFAQDDRVRIPRPRRNLQIKFGRPIGKTNEFVAYIDAIGQLDGVRSSSTGKPVLPATRSNPKDCWPWIRSWLPTPGSRESLKSRSWCSSANACPRSSICVPP
jgi:hypothetical protein